MITVKLLFRTNFAAERYQERDFSTLQKAKDFYSYNLRRILSWGWDYAIQIEEDGRTVQGQCQGMKIRNYGHRKKIPFKTETRALKQARPG